MSDLSFSESTNLWLIAATVVCVFLPFVCSRKPEPEVKKPSKVDVLTVRMECLQEDLLILKAHQLIHKDIIVDLAEAREMISSLRRELRQKTDLLVEGLCVAGHERGDIISWTKTLKSKMNLI
jgi:hypothetical protein